MKRLLLSSLVLFSASIDAATYRYELQGTITRASILDELSIGDSWSATFYIDSNEASSVPDPWVNSYSNLSGTLQISDVLDIDVGTTIGSGIAVVNDSPVGGSPYDELSFGNEQVGTFDSQYFFGDVAVRGFVIGLRSDSANWLGTGVSPVLAESTTAELSDFDGFALLDITVACADNSCFPPSVRGTVDAFTATIVPIPAAVWLFGPALFGLCFLRRDGKRY